MSVISSILLFLLCLSMLACNARRLGAVNKEHEKKFYLSNKNDETVLSHTKMSVLPKLKPSLSKESRTIDNTQNPKDSKSNRKESRGQKGKISGAVQNESVASVSWHVPHEKRGERQPGFNLDYSPPKTHPPSHN